MTISNNKEAYVWIWLPDASFPIVAGKIEKIGQHHSFYYGKSYVNNPNAISLSRTTLPLAHGKRYTSKYELHSVFNDALPDAWGQRVLHYQYQNTELKLLDILLLSNQDRIGALHFQNSATDYQPPLEDHPSIKQLMEATQLVETGKKLPKNLSKALLHGSSVGGARPKALLQTDNKKYIAKFSSTTDQFPIVQYEYAAMWLANKIGLNVAPHQLIQTFGKYVLLVERFDRVFKNDWKRKFIVSALTLLDLHETEARYASYLDLADQIRKFCLDPKKDLIELFRRILFNILIGNTDDHAKNHAFFWDGNDFQLTPAYDICPYYRVSQQATQAMTIGKYGNYSFLKNVIQSASWFDLTQIQAKEIADQLVDEVKIFFKDACENALLSSFQHDQLLGTAVLNPYCFYDQP